MRLLASQVRWVRLLNLLTASKIPCTFFVALGFLPGKEVKAAKSGNLGLQDRELASSHLFLVVITNLRLERLALRWIQKYIAGFGGDPSKVTMSAHSV